MLLLLSYRSPCRSFVESNRSRDVSSLPGHRWLRHACDIWRLSFPSYSIQEAKPLYRISKSNDSDLKGGGGAIEDAVKSPNGFFFFLFPRFLRSKLASLDK